GRLARLAAPLATEHQAAPSRHRNPTVSPAQPPAQPPRPARPCLDRSHQSVERPRSARVRRFSWSACRSAAGTFPNVPDDRRTLLRSWIAQLTTSPLDPCQEGEQRYVQLEHAGREGVDTLHSTIILAEGTTTQLLSGPAGSGKTTELNRLRGLLREDGFT